MQILCHIFFSNSVQSLLQGESLRNGKTQMANEIHTRTENLISTNCY